MMTEKKTIVIVGGGAGGLELAARLARNAKLMHKTKLILIDDKLKHVWKPLLHEVATGTLLSSEDEIDYLSYASGKFQYEYGRMEEINRLDKTVQVAPVFDQLNQEILPARKIHYDILVLAIGSISNDFNIPGVSEHCVFLDTLQQAEVLNKLIVQHIIKLLNYSCEETPQFQIAIVGGGATGIELAAEIHYAMALVSQLKSPEMSPKVNVLISVIESAKRILPHLPERISNAASDYLKKLGIHILTEKLVVKVDEHTLHTKEGITIHADLIIWAAGVKVAGVAKRLDGLAINQINQVMVNDKLQSITDETVFALGDCASCPQKNEQGINFFVPPRAQAAHQQAKTLAESFYNQCIGKPLISYQYTDYGSLITISKYDTFGRLMSHVAKNLYIEGKLARLTYWLLYKKHQAVLWGTWRVISMTIADMVSSKIRPKLKLH